MPVQIRTMVAEDADAVATLFPDLGYSATTAQVRERYSQIVKRPNNALFIAAQDDKIVGWVHVYGVRLLESEGYAEIGGIVIRSAWQRQGIGTQLIQRAERWAFEHNYLRVRLRSGVHRSEAHCFYEALGYSKSKASYAFELDLSSTSRS